MTRVEPTPALLHFAEPLTSSAHVTSVRFLYPGSRLDVTRKQILAVEKVEQPGATIVLNRDNPHPSNPLSAQDAERANHATRPARRHMDAGIRATQ